MVAYAKCAKHPEFRDRTVFEMFEDERKSLMPVLGPFAGFVEKPMRVTTTCLVSHDRSKYSIDARAAGRSVLVRAYADRIVVLLDDEVVADHPRCFRREQVIYDPWHYLPVLLRKPGALRNGAPFKDWDLPAPLTSVHDRLRHHADGDRQFVKILGRVPDDGIAAVTEACAEAGTVTATIGSRKLGRARMISSCDASGLAPRLHSRSSERLQSSS